MAESVCVCVAKTLGVEGGLVVSWLWNAAEMEGGGEDREMKIEC
jgi:hypothetical protein